MIKNDQLHFMISASYQTATMLSMLYFQLFLTYITLGLQYFPRFGIYTQFLTMSGVACFLASLSLNRMGAMFFLSQYANHPLIMETSWSSPRTKYHLLSNLLLMVAGISSLVLSRYPAYSYYILPFYLYPLFHIVRAAQLKTKKSFLWYYQLIVWLPSVTHPIFIRGSRNNYLTLVPWPALQYLLIGGMAFMVSSFDPGLDLMAAELLRPAVLHTQSAAARPLRVRDRRGLAARRPSDRRVSDLLHADQPEPVRPRGRRQTQR